MTGAAAAAALGGVLPDVVGGVGDELFDDVGAPLGHVDSSPGQAGGLASAGRAKDHEVPHDVERVLDSRVEELARLFRCPDHDGAGLLSGLAPAGHAFVGPDERVGAVVLGDGDAVGPVLGDQLLPDGVAEGGGDGVEVSLLGAGATVLAGFGVGHLQRRLGGLPSGTQVGRSGLLGLLPCSGPSLRRPTRRRHGGRRRRTGHRRAAAYEKRPPTPHRMLSVRGSPYSAPTRSCSQTSLRYETVTARPRCV